MNLRSMKSATLLALAVCSTLCSTTALAQEDPPARVGRVSLTQGQVSVSSEGEVANTALVNWPVTSNQTISTAPGARTELRIGSSAIRLDGDSALEVVQLDDEKLRLRLHYGSASIRVVNAEVAAGFELTTPQTRVLLQQPGRLRIDAERMQDTSSIRVFDGVAVVEGNGERLTVRSGRSAEMQGLDLRMTQAMTDAFDDWAALRDREFDSVRATRYVPAEMTGYEDLDRYGSWTENSEYGSVWLPAVSSSWVPYRDGRWTWISPWGWTWVDNAPWGYAPFHYGRWVQLNNRWGWAPGRLERYPVWAPALVGWVGGAGWSIGVNTIAQGWYPLSPYDRFVPGYRLSDRYLRRLNPHEGKYDGKRDGRHDYRQRGLTVVPQDRFGGRGEVVVRHDALVRPPANWQGAPGALPPAPRHWRERGQDDARRNDGRDGRWERRDRDGDGRPDGRRNDRDGHDGHDGWRRQAGPQPAPVTTTPPPSFVQSPPPQSGFVRQPGVITSPPPQLQRDWPQREAREAFEDGRRQRFQQRAERETQPQPQPQPQPSAPFGARGSVGAAMEAAAARAHAQAQMPRPVVTAVTPPPPRPAPPPAPAPAPAPAAAAPAPPPGQ
ncbi:DUF6600 domain-containing protein, partial [Massilia sp. Mn16-1_5]|uniref:DUF6600 domain-containing protein n=1 Tax=Massilia sp. Mn16-1_5 TaxID=2079199 RepID=UPI00113B0960